MRIIILDIINRPVFIRIRTFWRLASVSVFTWYLLLWVQSTEIIPVPETLSFK
jgi:hypothetical protein